MKLCSTKRKHSTLQTVSYQLMKSLNSLANLCTWQDVRPYMEIKCCLQYLPLKSSDQPNVSIGSYITFLLPFYWSTTNKLTRAWSKSVYIPFIFSLYIEFSYGNLKCWQLYFWDANGNFYTLFSSTYRKGKDGCSSTLFLPSHKPFSVSQYLSIGLKRWVSESTHCLLLGTWT